MTTTAATTAAEIDPLVLDLLAHPDVVSRIEKAVAAERRIAAIRAEPFPENQDPEPIKGYRRASIHNVQVGRQQTLDDLHERLPRLIERAVRDAGGAR